MYLSMVDLHPSVSRNPYNWHKELWQLFPGKAGECRDFLFRIEGANSDGYNTKVLLQSETIPQINGRKNCVVIESKIIASTLVSNEMIYRFKVTANATKKIRDKNNSNKTLRVPLIKEDEQIGWIKRKFEKAAVIMELVVRPNPPIYFKKKETKGKLVTVTFEGIIKITNSDSMIELMRRGIGPAKSFGCGLISLARLRSCE